MMDCKKALIEANGDFENAIEEIRKKGQAIANKRADRDATEGVVLAKATNDNKTGAILVLNCETDFVAKNEEFVNFAQSILDKAIENKASNIDAVKAAINKNTCGILVEPLQGEGGMRIPPAGFLKGLREIADDHDLLLLLDEIQVGLGRTGKKFCFEHEDVVPDGLILGKALSGGLIPLSAFVTNARLMDLAFHVGSDGSTFGGYPLACVAGVSALEVLEDENLAKSSAIQGKELKQNLMKIAVRSKDIKEVRGKGLFIGIEVKHGNAMMFCRKLLELGIIVNDCHGHTIRISPPLNISESEIGFLVECLEKVFLK